MKHFICMSTAALALTLSACGSKDVEVLPADTVGLRITSEVAAGISADRITVIPNDVAPWLSQILLLSGGDLYRTTADGGKAQGVNGGDLKDIIGLMRKGEAGTALTLNRAGNLNALIEKDDEGRLARMNVSAKAERYDGFCQGSKAPIDKVMAFAGKALVTLKIEYEDNDLMTVTETGRQSLPKQITSCFTFDETVFALANGQLFENGSERGYLTGETQALTGISGEASNIAGKISPTLLYIQDANILSALRDVTPNMRRSVVVQDGLSTMGTPNIKSVFATEDSLGTTFSNGAVIAQDAKSSRLVLISLPFARTTLSN